MTKTLGTGKQSTGRGKTRKEKASVTYPHKSRDADLHLFKTLLKKNAGKLKFEGLP